MGSFLFSPTRVNESIVSSPSLSFSVIPSEFSILGNPGTVTDIPSCCFNLNTSPPVRDNRPDNAFLSSWLFILQAL